MMPFAAVPLMLLVMGGALRIGNRREFRRLDSLAFAERLSFIFRRTQRYEK